MYLPAATARAILAGFAALGLDEAALLDEVGFDPGSLAQLDGVLPSAQFSTLWAAAFRQAPREALPVEVGLAIPFGAFGVVDYLAGSAGTVEAGFHSLASHFRHVATQFALDIERHAGGGLVWLRWSEAPDFRDLSDEFTIAVLIGRFATAGSPSFRPSTVRLTRPAPQDCARYQALLGVPVRFGCTVSAIEVPAASFRLPLASADPALQATLRALAGRLELGSAQDDLEHAVRARLRSLLPEGSASAQAVARSLGMSERTLQRRLQHAGTSFQRVLDAFREAEAERLIARDVPLAELALRLGFSDQTAWNRAFRRWKGMSPTQWAATRGAGGVPPTRPSRT